MFRHGYNRDVDHERKFSELMEAGKIARIGELGIFMGPRFFTALNAVSEHFDATGTNCGTRARAGSEVVALYPHGPRFLCKEY